MGEEQELCPGEEGALGWGIRQVSGVPGHQLLEAPSPTADFTKPLLDLGRTENLAASLPPFEPLPS